MTQEIEDRALLDRLSQGGAAAWDVFLQSCAETIFRVVRLHADGYDERMDLFLFVCAKLREDDMRRIRSFRFRPEAPCRFSTWLSVVVRNMAVDFVREREGRFREFRNVTEMGEVERLVFGYHLKDGRPLPEVRDLLRQRHGHRVEPAQLSEIAGRVQGNLSASQKWRLLARLSERRRPVPLDPVQGSAGGSEEAIPLADAWGDPEKPLRSREADGAMRRALDAVPPRQRLALALRFRDGMTAREAAGVLRVQPSEAERLARDGIDRLRLSLKGSGFTSPDFEASSLAAMWPS